MSLQITDTTQMFVIFKAIELAAKGFDISNTTYQDIKTTWWNAKTKTFQTKMTDNVPEVYLELLPDAENIFPFLYSEKIKRNKDKMWETVSEFPEGCEKIQLNAESIKQAMEFLYNCGACRFSGIDRALYDSSYIEMLVKQDKEYQPDKIPMQFVEDLSRSNTRKQFRTLTWAAYDDNKELLKELDKSFEDGADFSILPEELRQFKVIDNRMYIPIRPSWRLASSNLPADATHFVLSKNPYDFYFCSYGSAFQSCFALNSSHGGWQGAVVNNLSKGCFMLYLTKDHGQKVSLTSEGSKYPAPYMFCRQWCWLGEDNLLHIDKTYSSDRCMYDFILDRTLITMMSFTKHDVDNLYDSDTLIKVQSKYRRAWYPDSLRFYSTSVTFDRDDGEKGFRGHNRVGDFLHGALQEIRSVSDSLDITKPAIKVDGRVFNPKLCPVTHLFISDEEDVSKYAKQFSKPIDGGLAVLTYIDGYIKVDALSESYNVSSSTNYSFMTDEYARLNSNSNVILTQGFFQTPYGIDKVKERLREDINKPGYNYAFILLRVINGGQITWIKIRKDK